MMSAAQDSTAVLFVLLGWDESSLYILLLSCALAPVFKLALIFLVLFLLEFSKYRSWTCSVPGWSGMDDHV